MATDLAASHNRQLPPGLSSDSPRPRRDHVVLVAVVFNVVVNLLLLAALPDARRGLLAVLLVGLAVAGTSFTLWYSRRSV